MSNTNKPYATGTHSTQFPEERNKPENDKGEDQQYDDHPIEMLQASSSYSETNPGKDQSCQTDQQGNPQEDKQEETPPRVARVWVTLDKNVMKQDTSTSADEIGKKSREHSEESTNFEENARYRLSHKAQPKRRRTRARPASSSEKERKTTRKVARKRHRRSATRSSEGDTGKETRREGSSSSSQEERATPRRKRRRAESQCSGTEGSTKKKTGGKRKTKTTNVQKNKNSNRKQSTDRKSQENKKHSQTPKRKS